MYSFIHEKTLYIHAIKIHLHSPSSTLHTHKHSHTHRERERERETERERDRERDRDRDRETEKDRQRPKNRKTETERKREGMRRSHKKINCKKTLRQDKQDSVLLFPQNSARRNSIKAQGCHQDSFSHEKESTPRTY
jgi:hypothetical protein